MLTPRRQSSSIPSCISCRQCQCQHGGCSGSSGSVLSLGVAAASTIIVVALLVLVLLVVEKAEQTPLSLLMSSSSSSISFAGEGIGDDGRAIPSSLSFMIEVEATTTAPSPKEEKDKADSDGDNCCCSGLERPASNSTFFLAAAIINRIWPQDLFHMSAQHISQWIEYHRLIGIEKFYWCDNWSKPEESTRPILEKYIDAGIVTYIEWPSSAKHSRMLFRSRQVACYDYIANSILSRRSPGSTNGTSPDNASSNSVAEESVEWLLPFDLDEYMLPLAPIQELTSDQAGEGSISINSDYHYPPGQFNASDSARRWPSLCSDLCFVLSRYIAHLSRTSPKTKQWMFQNTLFHGGGKPDEELLLSKFLLREQYSLNDPRTKSVAHLEHVLKLDVHRHTMARGVGTDFVPSHVVRMNHYWGPRLQNFQFGFDDPKLSSGLALDTSGINYAKILEKRLEQEQQCMASKLSME